MRVQTKLVVLISIIMLSMALSLLVFDLAPFCNDYGYVYCKTYVTYHYCGSNFYMTNQDRDWIITVRIVNNPFWNIKFRDVKVSRTVWDKTRIGDYIKL